MVINPSLGSTLGIRLARPTLILKIPGLAHEAPINNAEIIPISIILHGPQAPKTFLATNLVHVGNIGTSHFVRDHVETAAPNKVFSLLKCAAVLAFACRGPCCKNR
jgi:hypothetical protein